MANYLGQLPKGRTTFSSHNFRHNEKKNHYFITDLKILESGILPLDPLGNMDILFFYIL